MSQDEAKRAAGYAAAELVERGMLVGLGTGSTVTYFIEKLGERCRDGLQIQAVASSEKSFKLGREAGILMVDADLVTQIDLTVDGADEIDAHKRMIKGGGGALLREKILANMSLEMVVIVDDSKVVKQLGVMPLPVEIVPFAYQATVSQITKLGYSAPLRKRADGQLYVTDNHHYLVDIHFAHPCTDPKKDQERISRIPGVVETGFFFDLAGRVIIGFPDGHVEFRS